MDIGFYSVPCGVIIIALVLWVYPSRPGDPKFFKRAELSTRQLLRRIEGLAQSMSYEDRVAAEKLRDRVAAIHDDLLQGIMAKKKK